MSMKETQRGAGREACRKCLLKPETEGEENRVMKCPGWGGSFRQMDRQRTTKEAKDRGLRGQVALGCQWPPPSMGTPGGGWGRKSEPSSPPAPGKAA